MRRPTAVLRIAALATSAALVGLSAAPGAAATPLAEGTATGLVLTAGGQPTDSGAYRVTNDGSGETRTGTRNPQIRVLGGQSFIRAGTLAQNAATTVRGGDGSVVACAGLAGDGASVAEVGRGDCLSPGNQLEVEAGTIDLEDVEIVGGDAFPSDLPDPIPPQVREQVLATLSAGLADALEQLGDPGVFVNLGAIQSTCEADARRAVGDANLADVSLSVRLPGGQELDVVSLPVNPPPNTKLVTELDEVVDTFRAALQEQFETAVDGQLGALGAAVDQVLAAVNENVITPLAAQLAPLEENLLDGTLNKQVRPRERAIEVTALEARVLPVASGPAGGDVLTVEIGKTTCATADAVAPPPANPPARPPAVPDVPTSVPSGLGESPADDTGLPAEVVLGGLALVAGAVGVASYRRRLTD